MRADRGRAAAPPPLVRVRVSNPNPHPNPNQVVPPPPRPAFDNYLSLAAALGLDYWLVPATLTLPPRQPAGLPGASSAAHDSRFSFAVDPHLLVRTLERALALPLAESELEEPDDLCEG